MQDFRTRLVSELTQSDVRQSKRPESYNRYALALYMGAAEECVNLVKKGACEVTAFTECFTPTREMHRVARNLGLVVSVDRGQWFLPTGE